MQSKAILAKLTKLRFVPALHGASPRMWLYKPCRHKARLCKATNLSFHLLTRLYGLSLCTSFVCKAKHSLQSEALHGAFQRCISQAPFGDAPRAQRNGFAKRSFSGTGLQTRRGLRTKRSFVRRCLQSSAL